MTVRLFVTSAALMIFSWLAVTYLTPVPMNTYPEGPSVDTRAGEKPLSVMATVPEGKKAVHLIAGGAVK